MKILVTGGAGFIGGHLVVGVNVVYLAERIVAVAGFTNKVITAPDRSPEVGRFIANISATRSLFGLHCLDDFNGHLRILVEEERLKRTSQSAFSVDRFGPEANRVPFGCSE